MIREQLSIILVREMEFPNALVTITEVDVDKKLDHARVEISVIPAQFEEEVMDKLEKAAGYLQHLLLKKINIKPMPRIFFYVDHGPENAAQVEKALLKK